MLFAAIELITNFDTMYVLSTQKSSRLDYVLQILTQRLAIELIVTSDKTQIPADELFINYSTKEEQLGIWIIPEGLLWESNVRDEKPIIDNANRCIFKSETQNTYGFDVFSAIFYQLSRYEEYQSFTADEHGRFTAKDSLAFAMKSLKTPFVDHWIIDFGKELTIRGGCVNQTSDFQYIPTVDVDIAFAYRNRPFWLSIANYIKGIVTKNFTDVKNRFLVNVGLKEDPYNTFRLLKQTYSGHNPHLFFQVGLRGNKDKNLSPYHPEMKRLIYNCAQWATIGLHPSYASNNEPKLLSSEKNILADVLSIDITSSRQHFLKLKLPDTYRQLIENDIKTDFTMGFAESTGFRAGTCHAFPFYDLMKDEATSLLLYPQAIMDGTLRIYMGLSKAQAKKEITTIVNAIKEVGGTFVSLWHNSCLSTQDDWNEWIEIFQYMHKEASQ